MTLTVAKIIQSQCQVWSSGRIILTGKKQITQRKPGPVPFCLPKKPIRTSPQVNPGICGERSSTNRAIYLRGQKWPKNAFYCIDQSRCCFTTYSMCHKYRLCTVWEVM